MDYQRATTGSASAPNHPAPQPVSGMVGQHATETEVAIKNLHDAIDKLMDRLGPALNMVPPSADASGKPLSMASPLGERLRAQAVGVSNAHSRIEEILSRLDF